MCCQTLSLPSLSPYLPRLPCCCCCQMLCGRCLCPYFPPWPLLPSSKAFSWLIPCALCFCVISTIVLVLWFSGLNPAPDPDKSPAMRLIHASDADSWHYLILHGAGLLPSPFPNLPLLFTEAFQAKVNTSGTRADPTAPSCFISPPLPLPGTRRFPSPAAGKAPAWSHTSQRCKSPSCRIKYQILSWNTDTVNSGHCFWPYLPNQ